MPYRKPIDEERVKRGTCKRCGSPTLSARVGRTMALDVTVTPSPVLWEEPGPMYWCWTGKRLQWKHSRCDHIRYADHQCEENDMSEDDPFGVSSTPAKKSSSPYSAMLHPVTGKLIGRHVRVTNFIKGLTDDFGLQLWTRRMTVKGLASMPDELHELREELDVSRDAARIDEICSTAKRAAGGDDASNWGTHVHKQTEYADLGITEKLDPDPVVASRVREYRQELLACEITTIPELIERKVCHTGLTSVVTGTFDRIVRLSDGTYAILDVKTGSLDTEKYLEKWLSISAQLEIYRQAVEEHGIWNPHTKIWLPAPTLRDDYALVAHIPAKGLGCRLYKVPLVDGREAISVVESLRTFRRRKPVIGVYTPDVVVDIKSVADGWMEGKSHATAKDLPYLIDTAVTVSNLMSLVQRAKDNGAWNQQLSDAARARHAAIISRA